MKAITLPEFGGPDALVLSDVDTPTPRAGEVLVRVAAAGVNRADLLQRQGHYAPPAGESDVPGLEVSGVVEALGEGVDDWAVGDEVCALLAGGGYAEQVRVPAGQLLPVPEGVSLVDAAALPEVVCTVWSNVFLIANLQPGETLLVHGGSSGIGTMAVQLARQVGAHVIVTAGSAAKLEACRELGRRGAGQLPRGGLRRARGRGHRRAAAPTSSSTSSARSTCPATFLRSPRAVGWSSSACRAARVVSSTSRRCWRSAAPSSPPRCGRGRRPRRRPSWRRCASTCGRWSPPAGCEPIVHSRHPLADAAAAHRELEAGEHVGQDPAHHRLPTG